MYHSVLDIRETQAAVKYVKDYFEDALAKALHLDAGDGAVVCPAAIRTQ